VLAEVNSNSVSADQMSGEVANSSNVTKIKSDKSGKKKRERGDCKEEEASGGVARDASLDGRVQSVEDGNEDVGNPQQKAGLSDNGEGSYLKVGGKQEEDNEDPAKEIVVEQNGCLNAAHRFTDQLARKNFSELTNVEFALLFTRWYIGCEKEADIILKDGISGKWFIDNVCARNFAEFVVDTFVIPHGSKFVAVQKLFSFVASKLCGRGDFEADDNIFADLTIDIEYAQGFMEFTFTLDEFTRAVRERIPEVKAKVVCEVDRERQDQIQRRELLLAKASIPKSQQLGESFSVERVSKIRRDDSFGSDFTAETFLPKIVETADARKAKIAPVIWPCLKQFELNAFANHYKSYKKALEEGEDSGQFRGFKKTIDIDLRETMRRKLGLKFEIYNSTSDEDVILLTFRHFGPTDYKTAVAFLEGIKFDKHDDEVDSQKLFSGKFDKHIREFVLRINIVKACMRDLPDNPASVTFQDLTHQKIMQVYEDSFRDVKEKSVQANDCWKAVKDFKKSKSFDEINSELSARFDKKDKEVKAGEYHYTTEPTKRTGPANSKGAAGGGVGVKGGGKFGSQKDSGNVKVRAVVKAADRGQCCGSYTNHHGAGCSALTCVIWNSEFAPPGNKKEWKDSDQEKMIEPPRDKWEQLKKEKPLVVAKNEELRQQKLERWKKENESQGVGKKREGEKVPFVKKVKVNLYASLVGMDALGACEECRDIDAEINLADFGISNQFFAEFIMSTKAKAKVLMDPGAGLNAIHKKFLEGVNVLQTSRLDVAVTNLGERQCELQEAVLISFSLMGLDNKPKKYEAWFMVWEVDKYNIVLGREFCKRNGFTSFDEKLTEWSSASLQCDIEKAENDAFDASVKFSSKHPIKGYQMYRNADGPGVEKVNHDGVMLDSAACNLSGSVLSAARLADRIVKDNARIHAKKEEYARLLSKASEKKGVELYNEFNNRVMASVDAAAVAATLLDKFKRAPKGSSMGTTQSGAIWRASLFEDVAVEKRIESEGECNPLAFQRGEEFVIANCETFAEYNGMRARVYDLVEDDDLRYIIRVLGAKKGWWTIHIKNMNKVERVHPPAAHDASFVDVGIDATGIPVIDELEEFGASSVWKVYF